MHCVRRHTLENLSAIILEAACACIYWVEGVFDGDLMHHFKTDTEGVTQRR